MKPTRMVETAININYSFDLYQILELVGRRAIQNEPQQYVLLNAWIIEKWYDELLYWDPREHQNVTEMHLPHSAIWMPDTTMYNSIIMKDDDTRRLLAVRLKTEPRRKATLVQLLYPAVYKISCLLNLRFFPWDTQICTLTVSSWTHDMTNINYTFEWSSVGTGNFLENEAWQLRKTAVIREEVKFTCCPKPYSLLRMKLYLRRKPLFYIVNLIVPTSIITLISLFGFFTSSSASDIREEKVSLGMSTILSMSILMLMVSDQLPTTSSFIPLIGWFILSMIILTGTAAMSTSFIIAIQKRGRRGIRISKKAVALAMTLSKTVFVAAPPHLIPGTEEFENSPEAFIARSRPEQYAAHRKTIIRRSIYQGNSGGQQPPGIVTEMIPVIDATPRILTDVIECPEIDEETNSPQPLPDVGKKSKAKSAKKTAEKVKSTPHTLTLPRMPSVSDLVDSESALRQRKFSAGALRAANGGGNGAGFLTQQIAVLNDQMRENRRLAQTEYEWLASVAERCCFLAFMLAYLIVSFGINFYGYLHWLNETAEDLAPKWKSA